MGTRHQYSLEGRGCTAGIKILSLGWVLESSLCIFFSLDLFLATLPPARRCHAIYIFRTDGKFAVAYDKISFNVVLSTFSSKHEAKQFLSHRKSFRFSHLWDTEILSIKVILLWSQGSYFVCALLCALFFVYLVLTMSPLSRMQVLSCFPGGPKSLYRESKWSLSPYMPSFAASERVSSPLSFALNVNEVYVRSWYCCKLGHLVLNGELLVPEQQ